MENYDVNLNFKELKYLSDTDFLKSKHVIISKIKFIFKGVEEKIRDYIIKSHLKFPEQVLIKSAKISKSENYLLLPYLILDFSRYFHTSAVFAYRTMFWWGNFFSCTIHLQGTLLNSYRTALEENIEFIIQNNFFIATSNTPWEYHYKDDNYQLINNLSELEIIGLIKNKSFIKLSRYISIEEHSKLPEFAEDTFRILMKSMGIDK